MYQSKYQKLMKHLQDEHDLILLETEMQEIDNCIESDIKEIGVYFEEVKAAALKSTLKKINPCYLDEVLIYDNKEMHYIGKETNQIALKDYINKVLEPLKSLNLITHTTFITAEQLEQDEKTIKKLLKKYK